MAARVLVGLKRPRLGGVSAAEECEEEQEGAMGMGSIARHGVDAMTSYLLACLRSLVRLSSSSS